MQQQVQKTAQKVIIIAGPTAIGKTALLQNVQSYIRRESAKNQLTTGIEVINCDSIQVYRHLDIASAKPSATELTAVPHHLVDMLDPAEKFTAGFFVRQCDELIPQIVARGNIPVISGGTVFYLKNFLFGLAEIPQLDGKFRQQLSAFQNSELLSCLANLDPDSARRIHPNDRQRLLRACEVCLETGRPFSSFKPVESIRKAYMPLVLALQIPRAELYRRIDSRVRQMFERGLEQEILKLRKLGYTGKEHGLQGIGYRECFQHTESGMGARERLIQLVQQNSRNYAKRQITFLKQLPNPFFYEPQQSGEIVQHIWEFYFCYSDNKIKIK